MALLVARTSSQGGALFDWGGTENFALEISRPKTGLDASDRIYAAYPGIEYNIRAAVIGGVPPYSYELSGAPASMTIDAATGEISWPSPDTDANDITLTVTDTKGSTAQSTFSIDVATTRFKFFSPSGNDTTGDGSLSTPWQTLAKAQSSTSTTTICVFRAGTYTTDGCQIHNGNSTRWGSTGDRPSIMLAYPGEEGTVIFDHGYVAGVSEGIEFDYVDGGSSPRVYLDGIVHQHGHNKTLRFASQNDNAVVRRGLFRDFGPGQDGSNSAAIDFESGNFESGTLDNGVFQDIEFHDYVPPTSGTEPNCCFKLYATNKLLIEDCTFHDLDVGGEDEEAIANKAGNIRLTVRSCTSYNMDQGSYGGNQNAAATGECDVELCFCHFTADSGRVILVNHDGTQDAPSYYFRNTIEGAFIIDELDSAAGPINVYNNVVVNENGASDNPDGSHITHNTAPADITRLVVSSHTAGNAAAAIIDASGLLQGTYRADFLYLRGHEIP